MIETSAYFISDVHLGIARAGQEQREAELIDFLRSIGESADFLFILGDFFDFWIEYNYAIRPDYFPILHELKRLAESGTQIHYLAGNHDFALGTFLQKHIGITIHPGHVSTTIGGRKLHLFHGDGTLRSDHGYRLLRSVLRNPVNQKLFKLLHPDIAVPLANFFSSSSRLLMAERMTEAHRAEYRQAAQQFLRQGDDVVFFGHTHNAELCQWGNTTYCNTGNWLKNRNFATLNQGQVRLWNYRTDGPPQEILPVITESAQ
jgi:UDP-2,3-diacylglucosamine hydrolase